jgi:curved DNA-binding protein CbpA
LTNYYKVLGIDQSADAKQIKAAYKRLAMEYHPDRNPGNKQAEEVFKIVNEAYHTLSDPLKKSRHDAHFKPEASIPAEEWIEINKRKYRPVKKDNHQSVRKYYKIDKDYYKMQAIAVFAFLVLAGFSYMILTTTTYFSRQKNEKQYLATRSALKYAGTLFNDGRFDDAFTNILSLKEKDPAEFRVNYTRDSLVSELRSMATKKFRAKDFAAATTLYLTLQKHEQPVSVETIEKVAMCQYYLGNFKESLQAMKHLHNQHPDNLELVYSIGMINLEKLENPAEALKYFTFGTDLFTENLKKIYGTSFETTMNPADAPEIYFDIFQGRAQSNLILNNFEDAIEDCNQAIHLRPKKGEPYKLRAIANTSIKRFDTVCNDIVNAKRLGASDIEALQKKYCR